MRVKKVNGSKAILIVMIVWYHSFHSFFECFSLHTLLPLQHQHHPLSLSSSFPMLKLAGFIDTDPIEFPQENWRKNHQVRIFWRHGSCEKEEGKWVRIERTMITTTCSRWCWSETPALGNRTSCLDSRRTNSVWNLNPPLALNSPPVASTSTTRS